MTTLTRWSIGFFHLFGMYSKILAEATFCTTQVAYLPSASGSAYFWLTGSSGAVAGLTPSRGCQYKYYASMKKWRRLPFLAIVTSLKVTRCCYTCFTLAIEGDAQTCMLHLHYLRSLLTTCRQSKCQEEGESIHSADIYKFFPADSFISLQRAHYKSVWTKTPIHQKNATKS
jgi:hypothetical protein